LAKKLKDGPSAPHIGWLLKDKQAVITEDLYRDYGPMTTRNVSKLFFPNINAIREKFKKNVAWEQVGLSTQIIKELGQKYHLLLVPGLLTKFYPMYLDGMETVCKEIGISCSRAAIDTTGSVESNTKTLRDIVVNDIGPKARRENKKIVFVAHSKGGTDSSDCIMRYPEIIPFLGGSLNIQGPVGGAAMATDVESGNVTQEIVDFVVDKILHGNKQAIKDLAYSYRQDSYKKYQYNLHEVPIMSFVSYTKGFSAMFLLDEYTSLRYHQLGDGLVLDVDGILPGQYFIQAAGFDHASPGFSFFPNVSGYHNGHLMLSLLYLWYTLQILKH